MPPARTAVHVRRRAPAPEPEGVTRLRRELAAKSRRLEETLLSLDNLLSPSDWSDAGDGFPGSWRPNRPAGRVQDRSHAPLTYLSEEEWRYHVAAARDLVTRNHLALGFRDHVSNFIGPVAVSFVLRGQSPGASATGPADADGEPDVDPLVKEATQVWEEWRELAEWGMGEDDRQRECRRRWLVEGERTLQFFGGDDNSAGLPYARHVEPELIRTPPGHTTLSHWGWGVRTAELDDERELGLWLCDPANVSEGHVVEAAEYVRGKRNVDRTVKRGLSDFFPCAEHLRKILGLLDNMAHVARLQAAIAWWEEYPTATLEMVQNVIRQGADYQRAKLPPSAAGAQTDVTNYEAGTVVRTEAGRGVKPGPVSTGAEAFAKVEALVLRGIGFRWGCPGYFSGESDDSFASVLVTGSPFVRITEDSQREEVAWNVRVATRVLEFAERSRRLPPGTSKKVRAVGTAKPVVIADEEKKARTFLAEYEKSVADPIEYLKSKNLDPKVVAANILAWRKKFPGESAPAPLSPPAPPAGRGADPTPAPPGSAGGDGSSPDPKGGDIFGEAVVREGFTGTITDSAGRERHYVDGKQVAQPAEPTGAGNKPAAPAEPSPMEKALYGPGGLDAVMPRDSVVAKRAPKHPQTAAAARDVSVAHRRRALHGLRNEAELSKAIGGHNLPDSEPADVVHALDPTGKPITDPAHLRKTLRQRAEAVAAVKSGVSPYTGQPLTDEQKASYERVLSQPVEMFEVKTLVTSKKGHVRMSRKAMARKERWVEKYAVGFHLVAVDDRKGAKHSGHRVYVVVNGFAGTVRLDQMQPVADMAGVLAAVKGGGK